MAVNHQLLLAFPTYTVEARWPGGSWSPVGAVGESIQLLTEPDALEWAERMRERVRAVEAVPRRASEPWGWRGVEVRVVLVERARRAA